MRSAAVLCCLPLERWAVVCPVRPLPPLPQGPAGTRETPRTTRKWPCSSPLTGLKGAALLLRGGLWGVYPGNEGEENVHGAMDEAQARRDRLKELRQKAGESNKPSGDGTGIRGRAG